MVVAKQAASSVVGLVVVGAKEASASVVGGLTEAGALLLVVGVVGGSTAAAGYVCRSWGGLVLR